MLPVFLLDRVGLGWTAPYAAYRLGGSDVALGLAAGLSAACAALLVAGCFTRPATVASWFLLVSLNVRNPLATSYEDRVLTVLLFFAAFLPLASCWSIDARRGRAARVPAPFFGGATIALLVQFGAIYFFTALLKTGGAWHDGSAVTYALAQQYHAREHAAWALGFPGVLAALTHLTYWFELTVPFLLVSPLWSGPLRTLAVLGITGFHLGLAAFMVLGLFPWVMIVGAVGLLPTWLWERLGVSAPARAGDAPVARPWLWHGVPLAALALVLLSNVANLPAGRAVPEAVQRVAATLQLDQKWGMYAPAPQAYDYYHLAAGTLADGRRVDLERGGPLSAAPPPVPWRGPSRAWSLYLDHARVHREKGLGAAYAAWLCREWNAEHQGDERLVRVDWYMEHFDMLQGGARSRRPLVAYACRRAGGTPSS